MTDILARQSAFIAVGLAFVAAGSGVSPHLGEYQGCAATAEIEASLRVLGGKPKLQALKSQRVTGIQESSGAPWSPHVTEPRPNYEQFSELRDLQGLRLRRSSHFQASSHAEASDFVVTVSLPDTLVVLTAGGHQRPGPRSAVHVFGASLSNDPAQVALRALSAPDLRCATDTTVDGSSYHRLDWQQGRERLLINTLTALPLSIERRQSFAGDPDWGQWGDITTRMVWSSWSLEPNGIRYPRTWTVYRNGAWLERDAILDVVFDVPAPPDSFAISDSIVARARSTASAPTDLSKSGVDLAPGITFIPGRFNVLLVRQDDGIVVVDAPISPEYSAAVIREAARRYLGLPIKAVVTADFMWAHFGGLREYIAHGTPVYAPAGQDQTLRRMATAPHKIEPDSLSLYPKPLHLHTVSSRVVLGTGENRVELLYAGRPGADYGERMLVAYLPGPKLLYTGDLLPTAGEANFVRQGAAGVVDLARQERLDVASVMGIHLPITPWKAVVDTVAAIQRAEGD